MSDADVLSPLLSNVGSISTNTVGMHTASATTYLEAQTNALEVSEKHDDIRWKLKPLLSELHCE